MALLFGCGTLPVYPDQSPGLMLARKFGSVEAVRDWLFRQSDATRVMKGVSALQFIANPSMASSKPVLDVTPDDQCEAITALGDVVSKRVTGWPDDGDSWTGLSIYSIYWNVARAVSAYPELQACYLEIEPRSTDSELHELWKDAGIQHGILDSLGQ